MTKHKHLDLEARAIIQIELDKGISFKEIGLIFGKDCTSISKEIRKHVFREKYDAMGKSLMTVCSVKREYRSLP